MGSLRACLQGGWGTLWEHLVLRVSPANNNALGLFLRTGFSLGLYDIAAQSSIQVPRDKVQNVTGEVASHLHKKWASVPRVLVSHKGGVSLTLTQRP